MFGISSCRSLGSLGMAFRWVDRNLSAAYGDQLVAVTTNGDFSIPTFRHRLLKILEGFWILENLLHLFGQFNFHVLLVCWQ
jgi:hypothetical protein